MSIKDLEMADMDKCQYLLAVYAAFAHVTGGEMPPKAFELLREHSDEARPLQEASGTGEFFGTLHRAATGDNQEKFWRYLAEVYAPYFVANRPLQCPDDRKHYLYASCIDTWDKDTEAQRARVGVANKCPCCGQASQFIERVEGMLGSGGEVAERYYRLYCPECGLAAPWGKRKVDAVKAWQGLVTRLIAEGRANS